MFDRRLTFNSWRCRGCQWLGRRIIWRHLAPLGHFAHRMSFFYSVPCTHLFIERTNWNSTDNQMKIQN